jgi:SOUL heme-binding protein
VARLVKSIQYEVVKKLDGVEIRRYPAMVVARVEGHGDGGFNLLFQFISGNNAQKAKVAMTAPVLSEKIAMTAPVISSGGSLAFVMPEGYTIESTPQPLDQRVKIVEIPARVLAALTFSGRWSKGAFLAKTKQLLDQLERAGMRSVGEVFAMRYNSPFTPWFMRRNEVAVEVEFEGQYH